MREFVRGHERLLAAVLADPPDARARAFRGYHERQLGYLQAERFAHLFVMLAVGVLTLGAALAVIARPGPATAALLGLFLVLLVPYIFHYYFLENAVQRWYGFSRELDRRLGRAPAAEVAARDAEGRRGP